MATLTVKTDRIIYVDDDANTKVFFPDVQHGQAGGKYWIKDRYRAEANIDPTTITSGQNTLALIETMCEGFNNAHG